MKKATDIQDTVSRRLSEICFGTIVSGTQALYDVSETDEVSRLESKICRRVSNRMLNELVKFVSEAKENDRDVHDTIGEVTTLTIGVLKEELESIKEEGTLRLIDDSLAGRYHDSAGVKNARRRIHSLLACTLTLDSWRQAEMEAS